MPIFLIFALAGVVLMAAAGKPAPPTAKKGRRRGLTAASLKATISKAGKPLEKLLLAMSGNQVSSNNWPSPYDGSTVYFTADWLARLDENVNAVMKDQHHDGQDQGHFYYPDERTQVLSKVTAGAKNAKESVPLLLNYIMQRWIRPAKGTESTLHFWVRQAPAIRVPQYQALVTWMVTWLLGPLTNPHRNGPRTAAEQTVELVALHEYVRDRFNDSPFGAGLRNATTNELAVMLADIHARPNDMAFRFEYNIRIANEIVRAIVQYTANWQPEKDETAAAVFTVMAVVVAAVATAGVTTPAVAAAIGTMSAIFASMANFAKAAMSGNAALSLRAIGELMTAVDKATKISEAVESGLSDTLAGIAQAGVSVGVVQSYVESGFDKIVELNLDDMLGAAKSVGVNLADVGLAAAGTGSGANQFGLHGGFYKKILP